MLSLVPLYSKCTRALTFQNVQRVSHVQAKAEIERGKLEHRHRLRVQKGEKDFNLQLASLRNRTPAVRPASATSNPALAQLRHACIRIYIRTNIHAYIYTYVHVYIHTYIYTYVHVYIHN